MVSVLLSDSLEATAVLFASVHALYLCVVSVSMSMLMHQSKLLCLP